jgi:C1A family cysteine protease
VGRNGEGDWLFFNKAFYQIKKKEEQMHKKRLYALGVMLLSVCFLLSGISYADELSDIQLAIKAKGAKWTAGETSMMKLSKEERKRRAGLILELSPENDMSHASEEMVTAVPASLDWRNNGGDFVTPVRNQGNCGSCWAFATTAAAESAWIIAENWSGMDLNLSEQILVSCSGAGDCGGGYIGSASNYIKSTGLPEESCFIYQTRDCNPPPPEDPNAICCDQACTEWWNSAYRIDGYAGVSATVDSIKNALNTNGPLVTTMAVYNDFYAYAGGVYTHVTGNLLGYHAILIIGYDDPGHYFIVKNSWGTGWGSTAGYGTERGYFMIDYSQMSNGVSFGGSTLKYSLAPADSSLTVVAPNGGESWQAGTTKTITWSYSGNIGSSVKIDLYKGASFNRTIIASTPAGMSGSGSFAWTIPGDLTAGSDYRVNITSTSYSSVFDGSDGYFTIVAAPPFNVSGLVTNNNSGLSGVTMTFSRISGAGYVQAPVITDAGGIWRQTGFEAGTTYRVTPASAGYTFSPVYINFSGESSGLNFSAIPVIPASLTVVSPNGGENLKAGTSYGIVWTYTGNPGSKLKIEILKNGVLDRTITTKASLGSGGIGSYTWKISRAQAAGTDYRIRITGTASTTSGLPTDTSDGNFDIFR